MVKFTSPFEKKFYSIVISPNNVTLLELSLIKNSILPIKKYEFESQIFTEGDINKNNLLQALLNLKKEIGASNKEIIAFVILNLPIFFVQRFIIHTYAGVSLKEAIENKIKQTLPINLSKYLWDYNPSSVQKDFVYVTFFNKENIYDITYTLIGTKILPAKISHILYSTFEFIKNNFSLYYENSYQIFIINKNLLTSSIYEAGNLQNIYSEVVNENINNILPRIIQNNIKISNVPLDIIYICSDIDIELNNEELKEKFKIVNLKNITGFSPEEISSISIIDNFIFKKGGTYEIKAIDLNKELLLYEITQSLKMFTILTTILFLLINGSIFGIERYIKASNDKLKKQTRWAQPNGLNYLEEIVELTNIINQFNTLKKPFIPKIEKIFYNLKDVKISQAFFTENQGKLIVEIQDPNKKEEIKNKIQQILPNAQINLLYNSLEINLNNY